MRLLRGLHAVEHVLCFRRAFVILLAVSSALAGRQLSGGKLPSLFSDVSESIQDQASKKVSSALQDGTDSFQIPICFLRLSIYLGSGRT